LQPSPCGLLISVEVRCFDRYKIVYSSDGLLPPYRSGSALRRTLSLIRNDQAVGVF
jgi:hypothetical protein